MVDTSKPLADNASASSDDSIRLPPKPDASRVKTGPGALPPDEFDPLKHEEWEQFWYAADQYFQPINQDDMRFLRSIPVNPYSGLRDPDLRISSLPSPQSQLQIPSRVKKEVKKEPLALFADSSAPRSSFKQPVTENDHLPYSSGKVKNENVLVNYKSSNSSNSHAVARMPELDSTTLQSSLNSFPYTHRLVAAFLDESGPAGTPPPSIVPSRNSKSLSTIEDSFWMGIGSEKDVRSYQIALEERVKVELIDVGLLDATNDDELQSTMRHEQWKLRDTKSLTRIRKSCLYSIIGLELRSQAVRREIRKHQDKVEITYLERMIRNLKRNKKSRSKFQRLLQKMFGHYKEREKNADKGKKGAEAHSNGRLLTNGEERPKSSVKKKKKKADSNASHAFPNGTSTKGGS